MDAALLDLLRAANPWLTAPTAFPAAAAHRLPDPFLPRDVPWPSWRTPTSCAWSGRSSAGAAPS
jgi:hypothetical protein